MLPQAQKLNLCLSCWRRLSVLQSSYRGSLSQKCHLSFMPSTACQLSWTRKISSSTNLLQQNREDENVPDISKNPYYGKYQEKFKNMLETDPDEYQSRVTEMKRKEQELKEARKQDLTQPPDLSGSQTGLGAWPPKNLDEIMKTDLIKDKTAVEIERIWAEYHATKDCVFAVVKELDFDDMIQKSQLSSTFIYPLPRQDGFEFYLAQFFQNNVYFTSLGMYQVLKENAPPCLVLAHFTDFKEDKGIVLMAGQYDHQVLAKKDALNLVKQMTLFYGRSAAERYFLVQQFNQNPEQFQYKDLIEEYKKLKSDVES